MQSLSKREPTVLDAFVSMLISLYQRYVSPYKGFRCAHRVLHGGDSCSEYIQNPEGGSTKRTLASHFGCATSISPVPSGFSYSAATVSCHSGFRRPVVESQILHMEGNVGRRRLRRLRHTDWLLRLAALRRWWSEHQFLRCALRYVCL